MSYASEDPRPLSEIAIIDQETIDLIAAQVPPGGLTINQIKSDTDIADSLTKKHTSGSDNQDLSGLEPKQTGKSLSTNDLTTGLKTSYDGAVTHAGSSHAPSNAQKNSDITKAEIEAKLTGELTSHTHAGSGLTLGELSTNAYYGDKGKTAYDHSQVAHAPTGAEVNVNADWNASSGDAQIMNKPTISGSNTGDNSVNSLYSGLAGSKQDTLISATNIKTINSNSLLGSGDLVISGGADPFLAKLALTEDKPTGANVTPVTLGLSFTYLANSQYVIDIYAIVAPTVATTGCGFMIDVSTAVTYVATFVNHQLAITGTVSGAASIGDMAATSSGVSSGMVSTASQFVYGGGILVTGANPGTATFFFRSETTAVTTCKIGTMFRIMKMN